MNTNTNRPVIIMQQEREKNSMTIIDE